MHGTHFSIVGSIDHLSDLKYTDDKKAIQGIVINVNRKWKDGQRTERLTVMSIGEVAEMAAGFKAGDEIFIQGRITSREYEGKHYMNLWANGIWKIVGGGKAKKKDAESQDDDLPF